LKRLEQRRTASSRRARPGGSSGASSSSASGAAADSGGGDGGDRQTSLSQSLEGAILVDPATYLDIQTREVELTLAAFAPDLGIASLIRIIARVSSQVSVDFVVDHYQSTEGARLANYQAVAACAIALSAVILVEKVWVLYNKRRSAQGVSQHDERDFILEVLLQVVLPVTYFAMRLGQLQRSAYLVEHTVGSYGLAGIPWASRQMALEDKIRRFLESIAIFREGRAACAARRCLLQDRGARAPRPLPVARWSLGRDQAE
jgi:hypothetical protein